jgi:hypothetical protein
VADPPVATVFKCDAVFILGARILKKEEYAKKFGKPDDLSCFE